MRWACALAIVLRIALAATSAAAQGAAAPPSRPVQRGSSGFQISPKPCAVDGVQGTCMFVWQCLNSPGKHIGMCVDTFMFGSCCSGGDVGAGVAVVNNSSTPAVLFSPPSPGNKYTGAAPTPTHGAASSSYTTTSQKFRPAVHQPQQPPHQHVKLTARPTFVSSGSKPSHLGAKPAFETLGGKPTHLGAKPAFETTGGKPAHLGPKPAFGSQPSANSVHHSTGDKTGKPVGPSAPYSGATNRPHWGMSPPPADETSGASASVLSSVWTSTDRRPTSPIWHATTEPAFVTRPRPSSRPPQRLRPTRKPATTTTTTTSTTTTTTTTRPSPPTTAPTSTTTMSTLVTTTMSTEMTTAAEQASTIPASSVSASSGEKAVQCGVPTTTVRPEMRIVGGKNAAFGGWPWQVSVRRTSFFGFSSTHRCGGAVLNEHWIATAGHCVDDLLTSQIRIRVGEYDFSSAAEPAGFVERGVARKVVHPKYNFFTYEYDLALVRLDAALDFAAHVAPICLPATDDLLIGENATVTGWGRLSEGGTLPSVLQEVSVPIVSNAACKSMFLRAGRHEFIPEIFLCAGHETGGRDSCQGDSGGPLQVRGKDGRYFLAGIISWGIGCAEPNLPGVCTRISKFVTWILDNVT